MRLDAARRLQSKLICVDGFGFAHHGVWGRRNPRRSKKEEGSYESRT
jgi:hypothetical protein